jgi:hypothetical protein
METPQEALAFVAAAIESQPSGVREGLSNRALLVRDPGAWHYFTLENKPLILIPHFRDDALVNLAVDNGHHIIVPVGADHRLPVTLEVPRLSAVEAKEVLERDGLTSVAARHAAALARRSLPAYRRVQAGISLDIPEWARGESGPALLPLVLAGEWDETAEADCDALERLTERSYIEIRATLLRWRDSTDPPFRLIGSRWRVNAKEDAWRLLAEYATQEDLGAFVELTHEVLLESDPRRGLSHGEQLVPGLPGEGRQYSSAFRAGLADSLAMLGALGSLDPPVTTADGSDTSGFATWTVGDLMQKALDSPQMWLDLAPHFPALAEAAPDAFLDAVEDDLQSENPTLLILFEPQPGLLTVNYLYPSLLWALENLAWSTTHFLRVSLALAQLAAVAPETRIANSPLRSLMSFFRLWLPQCGATLELRLHCLDCIRARAPRVAWRLMARLLPTAPDSAMVRSGPGARAVLWRDWPSEATRPTRPEYLDSVKAISERLVEDVAVEPARWLELVEALLHLHPSVRNRALKRLESLPDCLDEDLQTKLWARLRELVAMERMRSSTEWAMPETLLDRIDAVINELTPADPAKRHQWLFQHHPKLPVEFDSYTERFKDLERRRIGAVKEIIAAGGSDSLFSFAENVEAPSEVGKTSFSAGPDSDVTDEVIAALGQEGTRRAVAQGLVWKGVREGGDSWIEGHLSFERLEKWETDVRVSALLCFPFEGPTLDLLDSCDDQTQHQYWRQVTNVWTDDPAVSRRAIERLIEHGRPRKALHALAVDSRDEQCWLDIQTVEAALYHALKVSQEDDPTRIDVYDVQELLSHLRSHPNLNEESLQHLEWYYLLVIGPDCGQLRLHDRLSTDPAFFVEVVGLAYKRDTPDERRSLDPEDSRRGSYLLKSWRRVPGLREDGTLDGPYLKSWVRRAVALLEEEDLRTGGLIAVSEMLAYGPEEQDAVWPSPAICDIIEELSSSLVDRHFRVAICNKRGVTSRGPFDGGGQERRLAERYQAYAAELNRQWPRVSAIVRQLAKEYRVEAEIYDREAERAEDDIG